MPEEKLGNNKGKVLVGILGILVLAGTIFGAYKFYQLRQAQRLKPCPLCPEFKPPGPDFCLDGTIIPGKIDECDCQWPPTCQKSCIKTDTGEEMSFSEAQEIALESECVEDGNLTDEYFCNQDMGTWWIDLDIEKEGCAPACVINVSTGEAEINWRCTGLIPPETEGKYVCPEDNVIDCMPVIQGEKEWFCSDDYLDWAEENCPEFIIAY